MQDIILRSDSQVAFDGVSTHTLNDLKAAIKNALDHGQKIVKGTVITALDGSFLVFSKYHQGIFYFRDWEGRSA